MKLGLLSKTDFKKVEEALAIAKKTNKLFPNDVEGMGVIGSCLRRAGAQLEEAKI